MILLIFSFLHYLMHVFLLFNLLDYLMFTLFLQKKVIKYLWGKKIFRTFAPAFERGACCKKIEERFFWGAFFICFKQMGLIRKKTSFQKKVSKRFGSNKNLFLSLQPVTGSVIG